MAQEAGHGWASLTNVTTRERRAEAVRSNLKSYTNGYAKDLQTTAARLLEMGKAENEKFVSNYASDVEERLKDCANAEPPAINLQYLSNWQPFLTNVTNDLAPDRLPQIQRERLGSLAKEATNASWKLSQSLAANVESALTEKVGFPVVRGHQKTLPLPEALDLKRYVDDHVRTLETLTNGYPQEPLAAVKHGLDGCQKLLDACITRNNTVRSFTLRANQEPPPQIYRYLKITAGGGGSREGDTTTMKAPLEFKDIPLDQEVVLEITKFLGYSRSEGKVSESPGAWAALRLVTDPKYKAEPGADSKLWTVQVPVEGPITKKVELTFPEALPAREKWPSTTNWLKPNQP
jgi:hypothetical protein